MYIIKTSRDSGLILYGYSRATDRIICAPYNGKQIGKKTKNIVQQTERGRLFFEKCGERFYLADKQKVPDDYLEHLQKSA